MPTKTPTSIPTTKDAYDYCMEIAEANGCLAYEGGDLCGYAGQCENITFTGPTARPSSGPADDDV